MLKKKIILSFLMILLLPVSALSQTDEIKDYSVMKGDTLWDISGNELDDPFLWPKVWKENPEIPNPDRIYPGQRIRIPLYLLQKERVEEPAPQPVAQQEAPPAREEVKIPELPPKPPAYLVGKNVLIASGYIADAVKGLGKITGSPSGRNLFGNNDIVFVSMKDTAVGDKFYIVRAGQQVVHPKTKKKMGHIIEILGIAEVIKFDLGETIARITHAFMDVNTGDLLDAYYDMTPPLAEASYRKPETDGYVVATRNLRMLNSMHDIVFIDRGKNNGVETGDLIRAIDIKEDTIFDTRHKVASGIIQVIRANDSTSTAIVRNASDPVTVGNLLGKAE